MKTKIDLVDVRRLIELKRLINGDTLGNIDWYDNGVKLDVSIEEMDEWKFVGLSNLDFAQINLMDDEYD
jgi:hypothetical protein